MTAHDAAHTPFPATGHDHDRCVADALARAETLCAARGARLTRTRRAVLEIVWEGHGPVGAYAILDRLREQKVAAAAPPTVYRALDFLIAHGLVHRIESVNGFVGCPHPDEPHGGQFLLCTRCGRAAELDDASIRDAIDRHASALGFRIDRRTVEASGLCAACAAHC